MEIAVGLAIGLLVGITTSAYLTRQQGKGESKEIEMLNLEISKREKAIDRKIAELAEMKIIIDSQNKKLKEIKRIIEEPDLGSTINLKNKIKSVLDESSKSI